MRLPGPAPAPTIDITIHFRTALPRPRRDGAAPDPHELVLARTHSTLIHEGFFEEDAVIWDAGRDGPRPVPAAGARDRLGCRHGRLHSKEDQ